MCAIYECKLLLSGANIYSPFLVLSAKINATKFSIPLLNDVIIFQVEGIWDAPGLFEVPFLFDDEEHPASNF